MRTLPPALALGLVALSGAQAGDLKPHQAQAINLGDLSGIAYYTAESDGYRVVTTLGPNESGSPVRFVAVLLPNQKVTISVPGALNGQSTTIDIVRRGDNIVVARPGVPID